MMPVRLEWPHSSAVTFVASRILVVTKSGAMKGHAEIAGGGIAGLSSAIMLRGQGWTVRVHERSPKIRELGTGIQIKNNAIEVLEELGLFAQLCPHGFKLEGARHRDR